MVRTLFIVILGLNVLLYLACTVAGGYTLRLGRGACFVMALIYSAECIALAHYWPEG